MSREIVSREIVSGEIASGRSSDSRSTGPGGRGRCRMKARGPAALVRAGAPLAGPRALSPRLPWAVQRRRLDRLVGLWPLPRGTSVAQATWNGVPVG